MDKRWYFLLAAVVLLGGCIQEGSGSNRITPVSSGGGLLGSLHVGSRIENICVFNTSLVIIFLALIGFMIYVKGGELIPILGEIIGVIFIIAAVQLFCQNEIVTFITVAILIIKPLISSVS